VPDVIYMHESRFLSFAFENALVALDDYMAKSPLIGDAAQYPMEMFKPVTAYKGKRYAMPVGFAVLMLRYNKAMFDKANVKPPSDQWKWEDLRDAAAALTKDNDNDGKADVWGWVGWNPGWQPAWWPLLKSYGATHFNDNLDTCVLNNTEGVAALDLMRSTWCGNKRSSPTPAALAQLASGTQRVFEGGIAAMDYILSQNVPDSIKNIAGKFDMGLELFPSGPKGTWVRTGGTSYAIPTGAKNAAVGWDLVRWLTGDEEANKIAATYEFGNPLIRLDYVLKYNAPEGPLADKWKTIVTQALQKSGTVVQYAAIGEYSQICTANLEKMATCELTAKQAADAIVAESNKLLKEKFKT
jgi:multiple sugar transport system substrate-binding protein